MPEKCIQHLLRDHREMERAFADLELLISSASAASWNADHRALFGRIQSYLTSEFPRHMFKENDLLFATLVGKLPPDEGPLDVLRGEHAAMSALAKRVCELGLLLTENTPPAYTPRDFQKAARALIQLTRDHTYKEDRIMFPMVARLLSEEQDASLLQEMLSLAHG